MKINLRKQNNIVIFDIEGEFRRSEIKDVTLHQLVKDQLDLGNLDILLNLAKLETIDSFCVGEILSSYISIHNLGGQLVRANTPEKIQIIFEVTALDPIIPNQESMEAAIASFDSHDHSLNK